MISTLSYAGNKELEAIRTICLANMDNDTSDAACLHLLGIVEYKLGNNDKAEEYLNKSLLLNPGSVEYKLNYSTIMIIQGKTAQAIDTLHNVLALKPACEEAYYRLGCVYRTIGDDDLAIDAYKKALAINPVSTDALNNLGVILLDQGNIAEAETCFRRALAIKADFPLPLNNLGVISYLRGNLNEAEEYHQRALALKPDYPDALNNLGKILRQRGEFAESVTLYRKALALKPNFPDALNNLGNALKNLGQLEESIKSYRQAISLAGDNPEFHHNLSLALLSDARFTEGWQEYEWRWQTAQFAPMKRTMTQPHWNGENIAGKTLLIRAEQGFGDTLQFCRYAPLAAQRGIRVILEVQPALARLMRGLDGIEQVVSEGQPLPDFDYYCSTMSLPLIFGTNADNIPSVTHYLCGNKAEVTKWRKQLSKSDSSILKVGLVWAGSSRSYSPDLVSVDRRRSIDPSLFSPLLDIPGIQFYSLQKLGPAAPPEFGLTDLMENCSDFADTAAFITNLDLVISVDTAVAHLSGALGKPVWLLNRFDSCWRWMRDRDDSPWYPTMRIIRQCVPGNWTNVIERVREALIEACAEATVKQ